LDFEIETFETRKFGMIQAVVDSDKLIKAKSTGTKMADENTHLYSALV